jgi:hypothetical protein
MHQQPDPPPADDHGDAYDHEHDGPRRRLTPLTAALLIPALALAVLAMLWLGTHARGDRNPTVTINPTPTAPIATPWPLVWPPEGGGTVDPSSAYGRLAIAGTTPAPPQYSATLLATASVPPPGRPDARRGTVQRTKPLNQTTVEAVAQRLGARAAPVPQGTRSVWPDTNLAYDAATSSFTWQPNSKDGALPSAPRDNDSAARAARDWLLQHGLVEPLAPVVATQVSHGDLAAFTTWQITVPHLAGQSDVTEITMSVSQSGLFSNLVIVHPVVSGAATYPVITWDRAWAQVQSGRARDVVAAGAGTVGAVHVDLVQLTTRLVPTATGSYVIPAYSFTDTATHVTLYWPALDPSQYTLP